MPIQSKEAIKFFFLSNNISLKNRGKLKFFLADIIRKEGKEIGFINYIFCSDEYLLGINKEYLKHDYYTDIITFELGSNLKNIEAEIYISIDRVRDNAGNLGISIQREFLRVMIHGLLHLCGYKDKVIKDEQKMRLKEDHYLEVFFRFRST